MYTVFVDVIYPFRGTEAGDFTDSVRIHKNVVSRQILRRENPIRIMRINVKAVLSYSVNDAISVQVF